MVTRVLALDGQPWYGDSPIPDDVPPVWHFPLTCVTTDEGIDGYTMGYGANGEGIGSAHQLHDVYLRAILGKDPLRHEDLWHELMSLNRHLYPISDGLLGMLDVAFWDIKGKAAGKPIGELLGVCRTEVPAYRTGSHWNLTPTDTFAEAAAILQEGYRGYKLTLYDGPAADIPRAQAAREAVGDDFPLMLDAVAEYSFDQALEVGEALARLGYRWFEEPVPDRDISLLEQLTRRLEVPILATETVSLRELPQFLERQGRGPGPRRRVHQGGHHRPAQGAGHVRRGWHEPRDPCPALVAARHRQPARCLLGAQLRVLRAAPPDVPLRAQGQSARYRRERLPAPADRARARG